MFTSDVFDRLVEIFTMTTVVCLQIVAAIAAVLIIYHVACDEDDPEKLKKQDKTIRIRFTNKKKD